jgi:hypothetical protein
VGDVSWFGLQQEKQVAVFLGLIVAWKCSFLDVGRIFKVARDFILLQQVSSAALRHLVRERAHTSSSAMRFWISSAILESRYRTSFSRTKFFFDCEEIFDFSSRSTFCARARSSSIMRSDSLADMDMYRADMEYLLDCRAEREPS